MTTLFKGNTNSQQYKGIVLTLQASMETQNVSDFKVVGTRCKTDLVTRNVQGKYGLNKLVKALGSINGQVEIKEDAKGRTTFVFDNNTSYDVLEVRPMPANYKGKTKNLRLSNLLEVWKMLMNAKELAIKLLEDKYMNGEIGNKVYIPTLKKLEQSPDGHDLLYYIGIM